MSDPTVEAICPLSPQQQGMLYETIGAPESGIHVEQEVTMLDGELDVRAFEQAWQGLVDRHTILRTVFAWKSQKEPLQVVLRQVPARVEWGDWRRLSATGQQDRLESYLASDRRRGYDLSRAPLVRLALFRLGEHRHQVVRSFHHILLDGWCLPILNQELYKLYEAFRRGEELSLAPARPYREYLAWLKRQDLAPARAYWRQRLSGCRAPTPLGQPDEAREDEPSGERYGTLEGSLPESATAALVTRARQQRLTLNTVAQGVWALLLSRHSGEEDVLFGTTVSGRPAELPGVEAMIGLFANTLPFRLRVRREAALWAWLRELQQQHLELRQYDHCSAGQVHLWSEVPGSLPLFESILVFENYPEATIPPTAGLQMADVRRSRSIGARTHYALTLLLIAGRDLTIRLVYDRRRLDDEAGRRVLRNLVALLDRIGAEADLTVGQLLEGVSPADVPRVRPRTVQRPVGLPHTPAPPRTPTEARLAQIWAEVMGIGAIGIHDSFYELGGHSLLAGQIVARARQAFQVELPLRTLFEQPTIAGLAEWLASMRQDPDAGQPSSLGATPRSGPLPLSSAQRRLWILDQMSPGCPVYNVPAALPLKGPLSVAALERCLNEILRRHEALRSVFAAVDGQPVQSVPAFAPLQLTMADLAGLPERERLGEARRLAQEEARQGFDLSRGPFLRARLLRLGETEHRLLLTMHHIAADRWSLGVLIRELEALYEACAQGRPSPLPPLPIQYGDYALWEQGWLMEESIQSQVRYWRERLAAPLPPPLLPADRPRPEMPTFRGDLQVHRLSPTLTGRLQELSRRQGVTLFMTLLAGFQALLHTRSGEEEIIVGTNVARRHRVETEELIGFFINQLALRTDLSGGPTFRELLGRVREVALGAYSHQDLPFDRLVEILRPERAPGHTPLFQVLFVQNTPLPSVELSTGLSLGPPEIDSSWSKFDLAVFLEETAEGLVGSWAFKADLFEPTTITRMGNAYSALLEHAVAWPDARLSELAAAIAETEREQQIAEKNARSESHRKKFRSTQAKAIRFPSDRLIPADRVQPDAVVPLTEGSHGP